MFQDQMLPQLFHRLILDQAIVAVQYSETERKQFCQQICGEQSYQVWLQQQGVTPQQFETWIERELKIRKFQRQRWGKKLNSYFLQRKHQLDRVVCSLIYLSNQEIASELYFRIAEKEQTFAEVACVYSEGAEAAMGGKVGPIELGKLHPDLAKLFYRGRPRQLWEPTKIGEWVVIAQLEEILPVQLDESMQQILLNELLETWLQNQLKQRFSST